jgi:hypothetical protein
MAAIICNVCNIRRAKTGAKGTETSPFNDMCNYCYEEGGWENTHSDYLHDSLVAGTLSLAETTFTSQDDLDKWVAEQVSDMASCWICHPELNLAQKPASKGAHGPTGGFTRRPQLNHKGHSHPATPAARRACKALFWAQTAVEAAKWDAKLDGFGKPLPAPKGGWAGVTPLTKAGKVSLKATQAKVDAVNASK